MACDSPGRLDLAEVAGLSRYHFSRVFREEVGQTPWAFVRAARVRHATELLAEGCPPAEAAHEAGRAFVEAYVHFMHFGEELEAMAGGHRH